MEILSIQDVKKKAGAKLKVEKWLDFIGEFDASTRNEVLENCAKDKDARSYFIKRWEKDCAE